MASVDPDCSKATGDFQTHLPLHHRDPFDRLMISQALRRQIGVLSRDDQWDAYGLKRVW
jgi:PIN domain nuclease of toxin-antitoxin system